MIVRHLNPVLKMADILLSPFMWLLNGFKFPLQETHAWHVYRIDPKFIKPGNSIKIDSEDTMARFTHNSPLGLYHMPIFGGLTKYVVVEVSKYTDHWHIGWGGINMVQIHKLKITENRLKLLTGKGAWRGFAVDDAGKILRLKIVGFGRIGDNKYNGVRLF
jgi:hypothetical protein